MRPIRTIRKATKHPHPRSTHNGPAGNGALVSTSAQGEGNAPTQRHPPMPEFHQLSIFLSVVDTCSFTGTARSMGCTQPAISQAIARLEDIFGGDLFERRRGKPLSLTPIGQAILPSARTIMGALDQQRVDASETAQGRKGDLTLGIFPGLVAGPLRAGIAEFVATNPEVKLHLVEGYPDDLRKRLLDRTIALLIDVTTGDGADTEIGDGLASEALWSERLVVALPADHELARSQTLGWGDIAEIPVMLGTSRDQKIDYRRLFRLGTAHDITVEWHDVSQAALLDMVGIGMGATLLIESGAPPHENVVFRRISVRPDPISTRALWIENDQNPIRHRLLQTIRRWRI